MTPDYAESNYSASVPLRDYSADGQWRQAAAYEARLRMQYKKQRQEKQAETDDAYLAHLSPAQQRAVELTVQGYKDTHIARKMGLSTRTLYRWKTDDPEYKTALEQARREAHFSNNDCYRSLLSMASNIFIKSLKDTSQDVQFRAAYALLMMNGSFRPQPLMDDPQQDANDGPVPPEEWVQEEMKRLEDEGAEQIDAQ